MAESNSPRKATLCWNCQNACGKCSWSKDFTPVKGWKAKKTKIRFGNSYDESYHVTKCPEYKKDERKKKQ